MRALKEMTPLQLDRNFEAPSIPLVLSRIIQTLDNDTATAGDLERLVMHDPSLSARLLRLANSAFYSLRCEVKTISHAITLLGLNLVKSLAIGVSLFESFTRGMKAEAEPINHLWLHSFGVGLVSQEIWKQRRNKREGEFAFLCGLLHDLGKVVFFKFDPKTYARLFAEEEKSEKPSLLRKELECFGVDHASVGSKLAREWGFPPDLCQVIGRHHDVLETDAPLVAGVAVADQLARMAGLGFDGDILGGDDFCRLQSYLNMKEAEQLNLLEYTERQRKEAESFFLLGG